jgi:hypothetical protein
MTSAPWALDTSARSAPHKQWSWPYPFVRYRQILNDDPAFARAADSELTLWHMALDRASEDGRALIVGHGGVTEPTLAAADPIGDDLSWKQPFSHLEGVRLAFDDGQFLVVDFDRYSPADAEATATS